MLLADGDALVLLDAVLQVADRIRLAHGHLQFGPRQRLDDNVKIRRPHRRLVGWLVIVLKDVQGQQLIVECMYVSRDLLYQNVNKASNKEWLLQIPVWQLNKPIWDWSIIMNLTYFVKKPRSRMGQNVIRRGTAAAALFPTQPLRFDTAVVQVHDKQGDDDEKCVYMWGNTISWGQLFCGIRNSVSCLFKLRNGQRKSPHIIETN